MTDTNIVAVIPKSLVSKDVPMKTVELEKQKEFRFDIEFDQTVVIKLIRGTAEFFGTELAQFREYQFTGAKGAIFTWHGCALEVYGNCYSYIGAETPMTTYINVAEAIEENRTKAISANAQGPRVVLVGPTDSGKTTLSKILLNYATRKGHSPVFVDLDIGQGSITVPGMVAAVGLEQPIPIGLEDLSNQPPLVYFFGHVSPSENVKLYKMQIANLTKDINKKFERNETARSSGLIVNTCGWVDGVGYELLIYSIDTLNADTVLVLDQDRLYSDLMEAYKGKPMKIVKLQKSGGVVVRDPGYRRKSRMQRIKEYFYGIAADLTPHSTTINFRDFHIYKVGSSPVTATGANDPIRLTEITPTAEITNSIIGVSYAKAPEQIIESNLAGFLYVQEVNVERQKMTVLSPSPGALPSNFLIIGSLKWLLE